MKVKDEVTKAALQERSELERRCLLERLERARRFEVQNPDQPTSRVARMFRVPYRWLREGVTP